MATTTSSAPTAGRVGRLMVMWVLLAAWPPLSVNAREQAQAHCGPTQTGRKERDLPGPTEVGGGEPVWGSAHATRPKLRSLAQEPGRGWRQVVGVLGPVGALRSCNGRRPIGGLGE